MGPLASTIWQPARKLSARQYLVAGDHDLYARLSHDRQLRLADRREQSQVLGAEPPTAAQDATTRLDVLAASADILVRWDFTLGPHLIAFNLGALHRQDGVRTGGQGGSRHDAGGLTRLQDVGIGFSWQDVGDDLQGQRVVGRSPLRIARAEGKTIHHAAVEARYIDRTVDRRGQHATCRLTQRTGFRRQRLSLLVNPGQRLPNGGAAGETSHADIRIGRS